jgi:antitoxin PrlF
MATPCERKAKEVLSVESTLTSRGQTTIPRSIRRALNLSSSDKVRFSLRGDGTVVISRVSVEQRDLMVAAFLDFIEADALQHPQRVRAIPVDVIDRGRELSAGVEVDLDAPLDADEG